MDYQKLEHSSAELLVMKLLAEKGLRGCWASQLRLRPMNFLSQWGGGEVGKPTETKEDRECTLSSYIITLHGIHILHSGSCSHLRLEGSEMRSKPVRTVLPSSLRVC